MTTKAEILKAARLRCLECSADQPKEVALCPRTQRPLYRYRLGKDPTPSKRGFAKNRSSTRVVFNGEGPFGDEDPSNAD